MFTWVENFVTSATPDVKNLITVILWIVAIACILKPASLGMKAMGNKNWTEAGSYAIACVGIVVLGIVATVGLLNAGKNVGNDINRQANMIQMLPVAISLITFKLTSRN